MYERVPAGRRSGCISGSASEIEAAYGKRAREIAAELAVHFEQGRDYRQSGAVSAASGRECHAAVVPIRKRSTLLTKGLELLKPCRTRLSAPSRNSVAKAPWASIDLPKGFTAAEVEHTYARAYELCQRSERSPSADLMCCRASRSSILCVGRYARPGTWRSKACGWRSASPHQPPLWLATRSLWSHCIYLGELTAAREHLEQAWGPIIHRNTTSM